MIDCFILVGLDHIICLKVKDIKDNSSSDKLNKYTGNDFVLLWYLKQSPMMDIFMHPFTLDVGPLIC